MVRLVVASLKLRVDLYDISTKIWQGSFIGYNIFRNQIIWLGGTEVSLNKTEKKQTSIKRNTQDIIRPQTPAET